MKYIFTTLIVILMLSSTYKAAAPMGNTLDNTSVNNAAPVILKEQVEKIQCHLNNTTAACCYNSCDHNHAPFFANIDIWTQLPNTAQLISASASLYSIYQQPVIPPPIFS